MDLSFGTYMTDYYKNMLAGQLTGGNMPGSMLGGNLLAGNALLGNALPGSGLTAGVSPAYLNFSTALQRALGEKQTFREGEDVVMGFPPAYATSYEVDESKKTSEMTLDEYKRYICNRISNMPVSNSTRMNCYGMLVIKDAAFASMQKDPAYEKKILNMLQEGFQVQLGYQVIGGSEAECYGAGLPINNNSGGYAEEKSWWERRHEQAVDYARAGQRGSLSVRLEENRESRRQQRIAGCTAGAAENRTMYSGAVPGGFEWSI